MEINDGDEEEFEFSRNYFLSKEGSTKKSSSKITDMDLVDEQELRAAIVNIEPNEKRVITLMDSYKKLHSRWVFELIFGLLMYGFG